MFKRNDHGQVGSIFHKDTQIKREFYEKFLVESCPMSLLTPSTPKGERRKDVCTLTSNLMSEIFLALHQITTIKVHG